MELHTAIKKKMISIKLEERYPPECFGLLREDFWQMYVIGWEQGRTEINQHANKIIAQYDEQGKLINTFKSRKEAAKKTGFTENGIYKAMQRGTITKQGWTWKYI